ncbi:MAG: hypothetical protein HDS59_00220 [Barnesiella sp.]|nr:hypothetical protein [Barnesiella sp.]
MKKIMFNDRYGLTEAVLSGRKTMTRRLIPQSILKKVDDFMVDYHNQTLDSLTEIGALNQYFSVEEIEKLPYKVGEIVAIAQAYADVGFGDTAPIIGIDENDMPIIASDAGLYNKMFVRADIMPHQIRITNIRVEKLQDISDEDCIKELGLDRVSRNMGYGNAMNEWVYQFRWDDKMGRTRDYFHRNPKEVFAIMIDKICGIGIWEKNPFVFVYEFELVK